LSHPAAISIAAALSTILIAAAIGGCGFGPGDSSPGEAQLRVTREFGTIPMVDATLGDPTESDNVVRFLDDNADIETSFGGNFVDYIDGYAGSTSGGGDEDWFFFVNGYYSDIGAGEAQVHPGDRIWWDYRYWSAAYRVPAVVGSWPEPFLHGYGGEARDTVVECVGPGIVDPCGAVVGSLRAAGVAPRVDQVTRPVEHPGELRVLVGPWEAVRTDAAARQIESGPERSGVYGRMTRCGGGWLVQPEDSQGDTAAPPSTGGLVAAVRESEDQPTWVVAGTDEKGTADAANLLTEDVLANRYAVADLDGDVGPLPAPRAAARIPTPSVVGC
jgi:Domain of unknown function (DUF4430)